MVRSGVVEPPNGAGDLSFGQVRARTERGQVCETTFGGSDQSASHPCYRRGCGEGWSEGDFVAARGGARQESERDPGERRDKNDLRQQPWTEKCADGGEELCIAVSERIDAPPAFPGQSDKAENGVADRCAKDGLVATPGQRADQDAGRDQRQSQRIRQKMAAEIDPDERAKPRKERQNRWIFRSRQPEGDGACGDAAAAQRSLRRAKPEVAARPSDAAAGNGGDENGQKGEREGQSIFRRRCDFGRFARAPQRGNIRPMRLATLSFAAAAIAGAAESQTIGLEAYLARVDAAEAGLAAACEAFGDARPPEGRVWVRLGAGGVEIAPADETAAEAAAFWAEAALGAQAAAERLYGQAAGDGLKAAPVMIEAKADGVAIHDGKAMTLGDPCDALERLTAAMGAAGPGNPFAAARSAAAAEDSVPLPVGGGATAPLGQAPEGALAIGPDGVSAEIIETEDGAALSLTANADAVPGEALARIYAPGDRFRPVETVPLRILPGPIEETGQGGAISVGGRHDGAIRLGREETLTLDIRQSGRVRFASEGNADLSAVLETASGEIVAGDDDSGAGYGFGFSAELAPGRYTLRVRHCCGGGGRYAVTASPE